MPYSIIQPPFTFEFSKMPKPELRKYFDWFMKILPERIVELEAAVRETAGYEMWRSDYSPDSLIVLGKWFSEQVETRPRTSEEIEELKSKLSFPIDLPKSDLTNKTFSLAMDIGMYFSQVMIKNVPDLKWEQLLKGTNHADYGQPALHGTGKVGLNPVWINVTLAYGFASKSKQPARLRELYDIWAKMLHPTK